MIKTKIPQFKNNIIYIYNDQIIVHSLFINNELYVGILFDYDEKTFTDKFIYIPIKNEEIIKQWLNQDDQPIYVLNHMDMEKQLNIYYVNESTMENIYNAYIITQDEARELLNQVSL